MSWATGLQFLPSPPGGAATPSSTDPKPLLEKWKEQDLGRRSAFSDCYPFTSAADFQMGLWRKLSRAVWSSSSIWRSFSPPPRPPPAPPRPPPLLFLLLLPVATSHARRVAVDRTPLRPSASGPGPASPPQRSWKLSWTLETFSFCFFFFLSSLPAFFFFSSSQSEQKSNVLCMQIRRLSATPGAQQERRGCAYFCAAL